MINKVAKTIEEHKLINKSDSVLVALSGGPDSVALLYILHKLQPRLHIRLKAVYINHQIRVRAARKEEKFCRQFCQKLKVDFTVIRKDIPVLAAIEKKGLEETARDYRYASLSLLAKEEGFDRIAVGHQADDQTETILFRIIRGTGRTGLLGIPIKRGRIVRPLLGVTRDEIIEFLKKHRLSYCIDRSNKDIRFNRNFIRNNLLVDIRKKINPAVDVALRNLADIMYEEEQFLDTIVRRAVKKTVSRTTGGKIELALDVFNGYDKWLRRRLLRHCLTAASGDSKAPDRETVERLDEVCRLRKKAVSLPGKIRAVCTGDMEVIFRQRVSSFRVELTGGRKEKLSGLRLSMRYRVSDFQPGSINAVRRSRKVVLALDKVKLPLVVRNIRPGDRFQPLGMSGSKKVGDYLTDRKIPPVIRDEIPVVCDQKGIVWLVGFEIADRVKVDSSTGKVVTIECIKQRADKSETV